MFNLSKYILEVKKEYLDIGICKIPYYNSPDYTWMLGVTFLDIFGERLFNIKEGTEGSYEINNISLDPTDIVLDVGANIGLFSALACSIGCKVHAIEPLEKNIRFLKLLKDLNPKFDLTIHQCALTDFDGKITLYSKGNDMGGGTIFEDINQNNIVRAKEAHDSRPIIETLVDAVMLDTLNINVDFIKADIEGAEISMLRGGKETIKRCRPKLSLCSYHRVTDEENLEKLILELGDYRVIKGEKKIYGYQL